MNEINIIGSKSYGHRALIARFLSGQDCHIENLPDCEDIKATIRLIEELGKHQDIINVNVSESASTLRLLMPICA